MNPSQKNKSIKKFLPRLIIAAILINIIPGLIPLEGMDTVRNYANVGIVIVFLILVIRSAQHEASSPKPPDHPDNTTTRPPVNPADDRTLFK